MSDDSKTSGYYYEASIWWVEEREIPRIFIMCPTTYQAYGECLDWANKTLNTLNNPYNRESLKIRDDVGLQISIRRVNYQIVNGVREYKIEQIIETPECDMDNLNTHNYRAE